MNLEDDLKKYEVPIDEVPIWYHDTIREFIVFYCPDMHEENKLMLLHLLEKVEPKPEIQSKVVRIRKYA